MKHTSFITEAKKKENNFSPKPIKSVTDISGYRPDIVSLRDKAISIAEKGGGNIGLYDSDSKLDKETLKALSYARNAKRDITEIEACKEILKNKIEDGKETDKKTIEKKTEAKKIKEVQENIRKVAENTTKTETE